MISATIVCLCTCATLNIQAILSLYRELNWKKVVHFITVKPQCFHHQHNLGTAISIAHESVLLNLFQRVTKAFTSGNKLIITLDI